MVRTPLLPIETYTSLVTEADHLALLDDPRVRRAVAVGSLSLLNALDKFAQSSAAGKDADRARAKLQRYLIRMSTRPTPYGLFAGCANVPIGDSTDLAVKTPFGASHTTTRHGVADGRRCGCGIESSDTAEAPLRQEPPDRRKR